MLAVCCTKKKTTPNTMIKNSKLETRNSKQYRNSKSEIQSRFEFVSNLVFRASNLKSSFGVAK